MKTLSLTISTILLALTACSGLYEPCQEAKDCDPEVSDGCIHIPGGPPSFCSLVCQDASDCPAGPNGEVPSCILAGLFRACSI